LRTRNNNVGVDLDGVVADIVTQLVRFSRLKYDLRLVPSDFRSENIETCTPIRAHQLQTLFREPRFFQSMRAVQGARQLLVQLGESGYRVHIVTDRFWYPEIHEHTREWLSNRMIPVASVVFATKTEKQAVARDLGLEWFIEDQRSNANLLSEVCRVLLIDKPYNQGALEPNVLRVKGLKKAVRLLADDLMNEQEATLENRFRRMANAS
jgi:5'(3')-deoxyribonucleotidase